VEAPATGSISLTPGGALPAEDRLYIRGGAGGAGTMAIQTARWMGAEGATTASPRGELVVRRLGADHIINCTREKVRDVRQDYDAAFDLAAAC